MTKYPLHIEVTQTQTVEDIVTRTQGVLVLIEQACGGPGRIANEIGLLCMLAARDLELLTDALSGDAPTDQLEGQPVRHLTGLPDGGAR